MNDLDYDSIRKELFVKINGLINDEDRIAFNDEIWNNPIDHEDDDRFSPKTQYKVVSVSSYYDLIRIVSLASSTISKYNIKLLYRGQMKFYRGKQHPSLIRKIISHNPTHFESLYNDILPLLPRYYQSLLNFDDEYPDIGITNISESLIALEGILQHYTVNTRYIDLVDQLQTAIWFCYYKRSGEQSATTHQGNGYLFLYGHHQGMKIAPGITEGSHQRLVSLREVVPYLGMRPHIQQAYTLIDTRILNTRNTYRDEFIHHFDYTKYVLLAIEIPNNIMESLLGDKSNQNILAAKFLFPPIEEDSILKRLKVSPSPEFEAIKLQIQKLILKYPHNDFTTSDLLGEIR